MLRLMFAGLTAVLFCATSSAFAEMARDNEHHFKITVPDGWKTEKNPTDEIRVIMVSPNAKQTGGSCNVVTAAHPKSADMTQAQIDEALKQEVTEQAWSAMFSSIIFIQDVKIEKTGTQDINGHTAYYVVATFNSIDPGAPIVPVKLKQYLHAIPGEDFFVTCSALQSGYAQEETTFQTVFDSFTITTDRVAAARPQSASSITLYAQANFGGMSRVVTHDTPDLAFAGWHANGGSLSVAGGDIWQVCDGVNYSGRCRVVSSALRRGVHAVSARRVSPAQVTFAVMMQSGGGQSADAFSFPR